MDLTSVSTIKYIKNKYGFSMSKGLGQNFLLDQNVIDDICIAADFGENDGALEIGPGIGVLTKSLSMHAKKVVSIEIDTRLLDVLDETLGDRDNVEIVIADIMKTDLGALINDKFSDCESISLAANLPYYITTPILTGLLESPDLKHINNIVVMVQKEVAKRLCAAPGSKDYGAISVLVAYHCEAQIVTVVPASSFMPPPKVDSAVVKLAVRETPAVSPKDEKMFFKVVRASFSQRRKTLLNSLFNSSLFKGSKDELAEMLKSIDIEPTVRAEQLGLEEFCRIADNMM